MRRTLGPKTQLETLKKDAKRWLKALRAHDPAARDRLAEAWAKAPAEPTLRDVQHALALEYGLAGWTDLKTLLADRALARLSDAEKAQVILNSAWGGDLAAASKIAERNPKLAKQSLALAVMFGDLDEVRHRLGANPSEARGKSGALNWEPILYLAYGRLPLPAAAQNAVEIGRLLLAAGADPAARFDDGWGNPFTLLTGVIGMGEGIRAPHPRVAELVTLFLDAGTDPFDTQVLYDTSIVGDTAIWLQALYKRSVEHGDVERWTQAPEKPKIGGIMGMSALDYLLGNAVSYNHLFRAEWLIAHGADPNGVNAYSTRPHHEVAQLSGFTRMAQLLVKLGAKPLTLTGQAAFNAACARGDLAEIERRAKDDPALLADTTGLGVAAGRNDTAVVQLLLTLGMDVDQPGHAGFRPIHDAAHAGAVDTARLLIAAGADLDTRGSQYHATPLGSAIYWGQTGVIDLIAPLTRDVFGLTRLGLTDRLEEVFAAEPALAASRLPTTGQTPLFALPDDEAAAEAAAKVLLDHGVDPSVKDSEGDTAEEAARKRGLDDAADLIRNYRRPPP